jgi:hypothetical protein
MKADSRAKKDSLFQDAHTRYMLDIVSHVTPSGIHEYFPIVLPNSPYPDPSDSLEILLIVSDLKDKEPEAVVGQIRDLLLESKKSEELKVSQILTFKQLKDEYSTFEAKRALAKSVDAIVAEGDVFNSLPRVLGREFIRKKKFPVSIPGRTFKEYDMGEQILYALQKTIFHVSMKGQTSTLVVSVG